LRALLRHPDIKPDVIIAHSGYGSAAFVKYAVDVPVINYCELFYDDAPRKTRFRDNEPEPLAILMRNRVRNAMMLLDLYSSDRGYCPTEYQRGTFPREYQSKLSTIPDPIDTDLWRPRDTRGVCRTVATLNLPDNVKIVTYVGRGFERMRGFDKFAEVADRISRARRDVVFVCVGADKSVYGSCREHKGYPSYKEKILTELNVDRSRFIFPGRLAPAALAKLLALSDLHIYLTEPFVLSWSLLNALAVGCAVLASDTPPVREMICSGQNGMLVDFFDIDTFVRTALDILSSPFQYMDLRQEAVRRIQARHAMDVAVPRLLRFVEDAIKHR